MKTLFKSAAGIICAAILTVSTGSFVGSCSTCIPCSCDQQNLLCTSNSAACCTDKTAFLKQLIGSFTVSPEKINTLLGEINCENDNYGCSVNVICNNSECCMPCADSSCNDTTCSNCLE